MRRRLLALANFKHRQEHPKQPHYQCAGSNEELLAFIGQDRAYLERQLNNELRFVPTGEDCSRFLTANSLALELGKYDPSRPENFADTVTFMGGPAIRQKGKKIKSTYFADNFIKPAREKRAPSVSARSVSKAPSIPKVVKFYTPDTSAGYRKLSYEEANSPNFLDSREWKALRMAVLAQHGNACMCCGAKPNPGLGKFANVDHIKSRRKSPDLALCFDNLQVLCSDCNGGKLNWDETDWRPKTGKTISVVYVDEPPIEEEDSTEYMDMQTVRFLRDTLK